MFTDRRAQVFTREGRTEFFHPETGVEQGDPLSPKLWNIFYKPLLEDLGKSKDYEINGENFSYLAFADDIILIAEDDEAMKRLLKKVETYLTANFISIQPKKSIHIANYEGEIFKTQWPNEDPQEIPRQDAKENFTYLGALFNIENPKKQAKAVVDEALRALVPLSSKILSSRIVAYIINAVINPLVAHRLIGAIFHSPEAERLKSALMSLLKKNLRLPRGTSTKYFLDANFPIGIRDTADYHLEQEIGTFFYHLNSKKLIGELLRKEIEVTSTCHQIFTREKIKTKTPPYQLALG